MEDHIKKQLTNWTKVPIETAQVLFEESNDFVSYTTTLADKITQRAYAFSVIVIAAIGGLLGKLLSLSMTTKLDCALFWLLIVSILVLFFLGIKNAKLILPFSLKQKGRKPEKLWKQDYLAPEKLDDKLSHLSFLLAEIDNIQNKITYNEKVNAKRLKQLKNLIYSVLISFPVFLFCYTIVFILFQ